jgi:Fe2+ transport system protein FeoA
VVPHIVPLQYLDRGNWAEVTDISGESRLVGRMAEVGLRPGVRVQMLQPGCPCLLRLDGIRWSLRLDEAVQVLVRPVYAEALLTD